MEGERYLLEMTNIIGAVNKVSCLAEEGMNTSGDDNGLDFTLLAGWARENSISRILCDWKGFTGQSRLIDLERISLHETSISWDNISQLDADQISWYQNCCILLTPFPIPQNLQI